MNEDDQTEETQEKVEVVPESPPREPTTFEDVPDDAQPDYEAEVVEEEDDDE